MCSLVFKAALFIIANLVGGFNPSEKYESKLESSPSFGVKMKNI